MISLQIEWTEILALFFGLSLYQYVKYWVRKHFGVKE